MPATPPPTAPTMPDGSAPPPPDLVASVSKPRLLEPPPGKFPWSTRAAAPGLDQSAIDARAVLEGYLPAELTGPPGQNDPSGGLSEYMAFAFGSAYDRMVAHRLGLSTAPEIPNVEALLAFGYAACVRLAVLHDQEAQVRPVYQPASGEGTDAPDTQAQNGPGSQPAPGVPR